MGRNFDNQLIGDCSVQSRHKSIVYCAQVLWLFVQKSGCSSMLAWKLLDWNVFLSTQLMTSGPCITNVIATCRKNFSQWESSFLWKLRCHWLKFLRRVAKTLVIQGPGMHLGIALNAILFKNSVALVGTTFCYPFPSRALCWKQFICLLLQIPLKFLPPRVWLVIIPHCFRLWYGAITQSSDDYRQVSNISRTWVGN